MLTAALLTGLVGVATAPAPSSTALSLGDFFNFGKSETEEAAAKELTKGGGRRSRKAFGVFFGKKEKAPIG
ncbi:hypothetical protein ACHAWF_004081 [Thalassiosira exigua]